MRKIITSNSQIEFQEVSSTGTLLNSIGLQLGEVYFIIKGNKVSFYLNDSEKPFDSFIWSLDIPFYLDDELIEKRPHRKDMFDAILIDCDKYEKFCKAHHGYVNSVADDSINHIKEVYAELKREDAFLTYKKKEKRND
jgi:hypothetical protein